MDSSSTISAPTLHFQTILRAAHAGDNGARERLYLDYGPQLRRIIAKILKSQKLEWATTPHDIFDSVVLRVWEEPAMISLHDEEEFFRYLCRAIDHEIHDMRRNLTARRRDYRRVERLSEKESTLVALNSDPMQCASFNEVLESIRCQLSEQNREILDRWLAGDAWVTIGESFGLGGEAMRKRFHRSLAHIRCQSQRRHSERRQSERRQLSERQSEE